MIDQLNQAIYSKLTASSALKTLLSSASSVYFLQAPDDASYDYVVFSHQAAGPDNETERDNRTFMTFVRAYSVTSAKIANLIDNQIEAALHQKTISVTGYTNYTIMREESVQTIENPPDGTKVYMSGGIYRIRLSA